MSLEIQQNERTKRCFVELEKRLDDPEKQQIVAGLAQKDVLTVGDVKKIQALIPPNFPAFFILLNEFRRVRELDYQASPAFRAKTEQLKRKFEDYAYRKLVESVDPAQSYGATPLMADFGSDFRSMNRQLGTVINFAITVIGGFFFGFSGVTYAYPSRDWDLATRFLIGLVLATIIFFADLYFLIKNMDEELAPRPNAGKLHEVPLDLRALAGDKAATKTASEQPKEKDTVAPKAVPRKSRKAKKDD
ncbi:unnamed protein product, partial [Mesorhabditis spiculigera]